MKLKHLWKQGTALALAAVLLLGGISPMEASAAWQRNSIGWWWQQDGGGYPTSSWQLINGTWYYFDEAGYMVEGWLQLNDTWYYLNPGSGAMAEGWLQLGDTWYYLNPGSGAMAEGWLQLGDTWYYLNPGSGAMAENAYIGDYYLDASGAWVQDGSQSNASSTGATWVKSGNLWWYRHADGGYTANDWEQINGGWYYFDNAGWMVTDWRQIGGDWYYFGSDGAMKTSQWVGDYYVGADGTMATDQEIDGYYVGADGKWIPDASNNDSPMPPIGLVKSDYYYNQLNAEEKGIYDTLLNGVCNLKTKIYINTTNPDAYERALEALSNDRWYFYWTDWIYAISYGSKKATVTCAYRMTRDERDAIQAQIDSKVDSLLSGVSVNDSEYEKAKAVFEAISYNVEYGRYDYEDQQNGSYLLYDPYTMVCALINGKVVCDGYAMATQYMLNKLGVQCITVDGRKKSSNNCHAWNIARIDGKYYHIDTTGGDDTNDTVDPINYNYLCMTDEEIFRSHILDGPRISCESSFTLPECTSTDFDYYRMDGAYFESWDPDAIGNYIHSKYLKGEKKASIKLANEELYFQTLDYFFSRENMLHYCPELEDYSVRRQANYSNIYAYTITYIFQ